MSIYLHDGAREFRIEVREELKGDGVRQLENAWTTALSVLNGKQLRVVVTHRCSCDGPGRALLERMRDSGALVTAQTAPARPRASLVSWWKSRKRTVPLPSSGLDCLAPR